MQISKTTKVTKNYEIKGIGKVLGCSLSDILKNRDKIKLKSGFLKKCFICDCKLNIEEEPDLIFVSDLGNRFACGVCYEKLTDGN